MVDSLTRKSVSSRLSKTLLQKQGEWFLRKGSTHIYLPPNTLTHTRTHSHNETITYSTSLQIKITGYGSGIEGHRTDPFKLVPAFLE